MYYVVTSWWIHCKLKILKVKNPFNTPELGDKNGHFVDMMWKHKTQQLQMLATQHLFTLVTMRLSESCCPLPLTSIGREYCIAYHWPGKGSKVKFKSTVSTEYTSLLHHCQTKNSKLNHCTSGTISTCTKLSMTSLQETLDGQCIWNG